MGVVRALAQGVASRKMIPSFSRSTGRLLALGSVLRSGLTDARVPGAQFSLSESPAGDRRLPASEIDFECFLTPPDPCNRASDDLARDSLRFSSLPEGTTRGLLLETEGLSAWDRALKLLERTKWMALMADPLVSASACLDRASCAVLSQKNSHVLESRERPNPEPGCFNCTWPDSRKISRSLVLLILLANAGRAFTSGAMVGFERGFSGEGVGSLFVRTLTAPSTVMASRTILGVRFNGSFARGGNSIAAVMPACPSLVCIPDISSWLRFLALPSWLLVSTPHGPASSISIPGLPNAAHDFVGWSKLEGGVDAPRVICDDSGPGRGEVLSDEGFKRSWMLEARDTGLLGASIGERDDGRGVEAFNGTGLAV